MRKKNKINFVTKNLSQFSSSVSQNRLSYLKLSKGIITKDKLLFYYISVYRIKVIKKQQPKFGNSLNNWLKKNDLSNFVENKYIILKFFLFGFSDVSLLYFSCIFTVFFHITYYNFGIRNLFSIISQYLYCAMLAIMVYCLLPCIIP